MGVKDDKIIYTLHKFVLKNKTISIDSTKYYNIQSDMNKHINLSLLEREENEIFDYNRTYLKEFARHILNEDEI